MNAAKEKSLPPAGLAALRVLLLLVVALFLPETRVRGFEAGPEHASGQIAVASASAVGEIPSVIAYDASCCTVAAESETALLQGHLENAISRFNAEGFTEAQSEALLNHPNLEAAFRGDRIDTFFKESVANDPALQHLELTPRFKFGPDVFDPATQRWWDVTTPKQWGAHTSKYWLFGEGTPLFTQ